jgi:DNA-binding XRE family transcriptional regulator
MAKQSSRSTPADLTPAQRKRYEARRKQAKDDLAAGKLGPPVDALDLDVENATPFYFALRSFILQLKTAREQAGLTHAQIAERTGLAAETLCRLETGTLINPTYQTLAKYAVAVGKTLRIEAE